jgi:hypothetical protein
VVDVTESPINRHQKGQKEYYSGKKSAIRWKPRLSLELFNNFSYWTTSVKKCGFARFQPEKPQDLFKNQPGS